MGSKNNRYCVYSHLDVAKYNQTHQRPPCVLHEHISKTEATELTGSILYKKTMPDGEQKSVYEFDYVRRMPNDISPYKMQAIYSPNPMVWAIRRSGGAFGCEVHQLVHVGR